MTLDSCTRVLDKQGLHHTNELYEFTTSSFVIDWYHSNFELYYINRWQNVGLCWLHVPRMSQCVNCTCFSPTISNLPRLLKHCCACYETVSSSDTPENKKKTQFQKKENSFRAGFVSFLFFWKNFWKFWIFWRYE